MDKTLDSSSSAESYDSSRSSIATYLADHYGLVEPVDVRELVRGANRNHLVTSQYKRYVYRVYTDHDFYVRNPEAYQYELDLLAYFKENKLAVPEPANRLDGQRLSEMVDSTGSQHGSSSVPLSYPATGPHASARYGALFRFFEGEEHVTWHPDLNEQDVISFGGAVAEIHQRADQFQKPYCRHHFDLLYLLDGPLHTLESILYNPDDGYCILDFDQCAFGWRAYDVATFKYNIMETVPDHLTDEIWHCFLEGYNQVRPLIQQELDCLPVFANAWTLWDIGETLVLATQWGGHSPDLVEGDLTQDEYMDEAVGLLRRML